MDKLILAVYYSSQTALANTGTFSFANGDVLLGVVSAAKISGTNYASFGASSSTITVTATGTSLAKLLFLRNNN